MKHTDKKKEDEIKGGNHPEIFNIFPTISNIGEKDNTKIVCLYVKWFRNRVRMKKTWRIF